MAISFDDEKGGPYHGPYAWPRGSPTVSSEEVDEIRKMQPVRAVIRKVVTDTVSDLIAAETPGLKSNAIKEIAESMT